MNQPRQSVRVSGFQLRKFAMLENLFRNVVNERQLLQNFGRRRANLGARLAGRLQIELIEKDLGELLG